MMVCKENGLVMHVRMWLMCEIMSFEEVDPEGALLLVSLFLEHQHCGDFQVAVLELFLPSHNVGQGVLVVDCPHLGPHLRVTVNRQQSVQIGHHEVAVNELEEGEDVLRLVLSSAHFQNWLDREVTKVDLQHCGVGLIVVPGEHQGSGDALPCRVSHLEYPVLEVVPELRTVPPAAPV